MFAQEGKSAATKLKKYYAADDTAEAKNVMGFEDEFGSKDEDEDDLEDEDEEEDEASTLPPPSEGLGLMSRLFGSAPVEETAEEEEDAPRYSFAGYDDDFDNEDEDRADEDRDEEEKSREDVELESRLGLAYKLATATSNNLMFKTQFRQALATLGKEYTTEETDAFYKEAVAYQHDPKAIRASSTEHDAHGLVRRTLNQSFTTRDVTGQSLTQAGFRKYVLNWLTRKIDAAEAKDHFKALVDGAAEIAQRASQADLHGDELSPDDRRGYRRHATVDEDGELFIYARDLRRVLVTYSEKLTDEEADQLIRECRPAPKPGAGDGGLERIYFPQYLAMLRDETL